MPFTFIYGIKIAIDFGILKILDCYWQSDDVLTFFNEPDEMYICAMDTYFTIVIDNRKLDFISMNVTGPKLFQVFTEVDGRQLRFHMHGNGVDVLEFAMPEECPQFLLAMEKKIAEQIFNRYQPVQSTSTADNI